ncbi:formate dehydrogenase accessory like protein [Yersinia ruckeri]|nr:formate dehydrogenase accessory like protein [Yersinia ruckeri]
MSIRIVPKDQLSQQSERATTAGTNPPLLFANLKNKQGGEQPRRYFSPI